MNQNRGVLGGGFAVAMRHQRILWWVFAVNFVLGGLGSSGTARALGNALHHSLAGEKLVNSFDLGMFSELVSQPSVRLFSYSGGVFLFAALYFLFLLFVTPGIIEAYLAERRLTTVEFFAISGGFFWAFVRLALWSLIPFILVELLFDGVHGTSGYIGEHAISDQASFYVLAIGSIPVLLLSVWVRYWFDLAQVRAISRQSRIMRHNMASMFLVALRRAWRGYWAYVLISILAWIITAILVLIWREVPGRAVWLTFLLLEITMLIQIFGRLWQKACATTWYSMSPEPVAALPVPPPWESSTPVPIVIVEVDVPLAPEIESVPETFTPDAPADPGRSKDQA